MKTTPVWSADLGASVIAVPPLARSSDLSLNSEQNRLIVRHLAWANADFYNLGVSAYARTVTMLAELASPRTWVIPSACRHRRYWAAAAASDNIEPAHHEAIREVATALLAHDRALAAAPTGA
jgi:hypothetical protein